MIERVRERKEQHKQRGKIYRALWVILGSIVILAGLALSLPGVPGPGLVLVAVGLGMLALEFDRAERLLEKVLLRLERLSDRAQRASRGQKVAAGVVAGAAVVRGRRRCPDLGNPVLPRRGAALAAAAADAFSEHAALVGASTARAGRRSAVDGDEDGACERDDEHHVDKEERHAHARLYRRGAPWD